jgi:hypothetical protein
LDNETTDDKLTTEELGDNGPEKAAAVFTCPKERKSMDPISSITTAIFIAFIFYPPDNKTYQIEESDYIVTESSD